MCWGVHEVFQSCPWIFAVYQSDLKHGKLQRSSEGIVAPHGIRTLFGKYASDVTEVPCYQTLADCGERKTESR